ncbi:MAG: hypothetical protein F6K39_35985 [Okeania sp. SIO3B3]|nr:hypothetical protein [Okeania sp. SIO3B3]
MTADNNTNTNGNAAALTLDEFEPVSYEQWRSVVERDLKGAPFEKKLHTHTYEGIDVLPLYTADQWPTAGDPSGLPGFAPFTRGRTPVNGVVAGWEIRQEFAEADLNRLNQAILTDLRGGVSGLHLRLDIAARNGTRIDEASIFEKG